MASFKSISKDETSAKYDMIKAALSGLAISVTTYLASLACAYAQMHTATVVLAWPIFAILKLLPAGEPITTGSATTLLLPLAGFMLAWTTYSVASLYWLRRRQTATDA